jgi:hypothetical protein
MNNVPLKPPCAKALIAKLSIGVSHRLGESTTATHPATVPPLTEKVGDHWHAYDYKYDTPDQHEYAEATTIDQVVEVPVKKEGIVKGPDILKIVVRLVEPYEDLR